MDGKVIFDWFDCMEAANLQTTRSKMLELHVWMVVYKAPHPQHRLRS